MVIICWCLKIYCLWKPLKLFSFLLSGYLCPEFQSISRIERFWDLRLVYIKLRCFKEISEELRFYLFIFYFFWPFNVPLHESAVLVSQAILSFVCGTKTIKSIVMCPDFHTGRAANIQVLTSEYHEGVSYGLRPRLYLMSDGMQQPYSLFTTNLVLKLRVYFLRPTDEINRLASLHNVHAWLSFWKCPINSPNECRICVAAISLTRVFLAWPKYGELLPPITKWKLSGPVIRTTYSPSFHTTWNSCDFF